MSEAVSPQLPDLETERDPVGEMSRALWMLNGAISPEAGKRSVRELFLSSPAGFYSATMNLLKQDAAQPGSEELAALLNENGLVLEVLCEPAALPADVAVSVARSAFLTDPQLDLKLLRSVMPEGTSTAQASDVDRLERVLAVVDAISDGTRLVTSLMRLLRHPHERVCSKVSRLVARAHRNAEWFASQMSNPDPRVRANTIEGLLYGGLSDRELADLWQYVLDGNHRVSTTTLLVLYLNGRKEAGDLLERLTAHSGEQFRAAAAWAMGQTRDLRFLASLQKMARSDSGLAKRSALKASVYLRKHAQPVLEVNVAAQPEAMPPPDETAQPAEAEVAEDSQVEPSDQGATEG